MIGTNRTDNFPTDTYVINLNYAFAAEVYFFTGSNSILEADNMTTGISGYTYTFPVLTSGVLNYIWIVVAPEVQTIYDYSVDFSYVINAEA